MLAGNAFGDAGHRIVIEESSSMAKANIVMVDGRARPAMATSRDHKRVGNGDTGPNFAGGMGGVLGAGGLASPGAPWSGLSGQP